MTVLDYMKVIDIISDLFDANHEVELKTHDGKLQSFDVETPMADGSLLSYKMNLMKYDIVILIDKDYFVTRDIKALLSKMEYRLEQEFFKNIKLALKSDANCYTITVSV